jgi:sugar lactone lactonase YvrE
MMRSLKLLLAAAVLAAPLAAHAFERGQVQLFAVLPAGATGPEGLDVDRQGNAFVTTFGFNAQGSATGLGQLYVFDAGGKLVRNVSIANSSPHLLGVRLQPSTGALLVVDFGNDVVLSVNSRTGASTVFMKPPSPLPHPELGSELNDITFDKAGNVYVSDSTQGIIWKTGPAGGVGTVWIDDPLLRTIGVPPFGANGIRFNNHETAFFATNTGNDTLVKIPVTAGTAGPASVFANSINGADGLIIDDDDNLWVCANQGDEIVVVDPTGKVIAKLGDFDGVQKGQPVSFLFPASLRFSGQDLIVTNLALDLRLFDPSFTSVDSEWAAQVTRYTVSKIRARIPNLKGLGH